MGRPLFSLPTQAPAVRVEPEQAHPAYETWTYWNAFDPDADEFFENDNAVWEDFVDPSQSPVEGDYRVASPVLEDDGSSSSESESSGRVTPLDETERVVSPSVDEEDRENEIQRLVLEVVPPHPESAPFGPSASAPIVPVRELSIEAVSRTPSPAPISPSISATGDGLRALPTPPTLPASIPPRPSTPPNQTPLFYATPSPAPTVTPRLYTWASRSTIPTSPNGPLTNRNARMSVAHIRPAAIPIPRVVG